MTFTITVIDHPTPWNLSKQEKKEIAEVTTMDFDTHEDCEDWIENNMGCDLENEWAVIEVKRNGKKTWTNQG